MRPTTPMFTLSKASAATMGITAALLMACGNDTLRAQTPTTTTGPYNTGTTATPGLSATKAAGATGEGDGKAAGAVAPPAGH